MASTATPMRVQRIQNRQKTICDTVFMAFTIPPTCAGLVCFRRVRRDRADILPALWQGPHTCRIIDPKCETLGRDSCRDSSLPNDGYDGYRSSQSDTPEVRNSP